MMKELENFVNQYSNDFEKIISILKHEEQFSKIEINVYEILKHILLYSKITFKNSHDYDCDYFSKGKPNQFYANFNIKLELPNDLNKTSLGNKVFDIYYNLWFCNKVSNFDLKQIKIQMSDKQIIFFLSFTKKNNLYVV